MRFIYTAIDRGYLVSGHTVDDAYEIVIFGDPIDPSYESVGNQNESIDGTVEREHWNLRTEWRVQTDLIQTGSELDSFMEFITSVIAGEEFTFDPESDEVGVDVAPVTCQMKTRRFSRRRANGSNFTFTFDVRVVA